MEGNYVGIEFEVDSSDFREVLRLLPDFPPDRRPITERDGSLGEEGVEIIFPPIAVSALKRANNVFHRSISAIKDVVTHNMVTGMHMNVNTRGWSNDETAAFCAIVHNMDEEHIRNLGGRRPTDYCCQFRGRPFITYRRGCSGHYAADNKQDRIELRFPMSTCDKDRIDRLVDFIERLTVFARTKTAHIRGLVEDLDTPVSSNVWWEEPITSQYDKVIDAFYTFLSKTKKGRLVLEALHTPTEEAPEPDHNEFDGFGFSCDDEEEEDYDDF